jgi:hypothetical protein
MRAMNVGLWGCVCFVVAACGSSASPDDGGGGMDGAMGMDGGGGGQDTGTMDSGGNPDTGMGTDSGSDSGTGFNPSCTGSANSACGKPQSIVRVVAKLGGGLPDASGNLVVNLAHLRLGSGASGGVAHTTGTKANTTVGANTLVEVDFDMCAGGEMWSEENCEFNLWGFVDKNKNGTLDANEPAGRAVVNVSCKTAGAQCFGLVLDCSAGTSCIAFNAAQTCSCAANGCNSPIKTCQ